MKKESNMAELFRNRLADAEMEVRDDSWQTLKQELDRIERHRMLYILKRTPRWLAAASVLLVLGLSSAVFWHFWSLKNGGEEQGAAVSSMPSMIAMEEDGDAVPPSSQDAVEEEWQPSACRSDVKLARADENGRDPKDVEKAETVHFSFSITHRVYRQARQQPSAAYANASQITDMYSYRTADNEATEYAEPPVESNRVEKKWAVKAGAGTSLTARKYNMPLTAGVGVERKLNKRLSLELGLHYGRMKEAQKVHAVNMPLRLQVLLAEYPKADLYAMAGVAVGKYFVGETEGRDLKLPVNISANAGVGVRYKMNDRFALFAETAVTHCFNRKKTEINTLYTDYPLNLDLMCGVRMMF